MTQFDPPLKVGDKVRWLNSGHLLTVDQVAVNNGLAIAHAIEDITESHLIVPSSENERWSRVKPLAPGDEVVLIERRTGVVRVVSGETAIVGNVAAAPVNSLVPIELAAEGRDWERVKE